MGILGTVLLRVSSGTILPIFIEISSYLTDKEQKLSWHSFFRHGVHTYTAINLVTRHLVRQFTFTCRGPAGLLAVSPAELWANWALSRPITSPILYRKTAASGTGIQRVQKYRHVLKPLWTAYEWRCLYTELSSQFSILQSSYWSLLA